MIRSRVRHEALLRIARWLATLSFFGAALTLRWRPVATTEESLSAISCALVRHRDMQQLLLQHDAPGSVPPQLQPPYRALRSTANLSDLCRTINDFAVDEVLYAVDLMLREVINIADPGFLEAERARTSFPASACHLSTERDNGIDRLAATQYIIFTKHVVGQWAADVDADVAAIFSFRDGVSAQYVHGFVWHKMLTAAAGGPATPDMVRGFAELLCCRACRGAECNAGCTSKREGDWYHACFHGVGHGSALLALHQNGRLASYGKCTATRWLSQPPTPKAMSEGEAGCDAATVGSHRNRKYCYLGVYMSYFEYLRPVASDWASACDAAACPAACIIKCRQFASQIFDAPLFMDMAWPTTVVCYGPRPLGRAQAVALDEALTVYGINGIYRPGHGEQYTPDLEAWLLRTVRGNASSEHIPPLVGGCF
jgi:hypothetical protein